MNYFDLQCAISFHDDIISEIGGLEGYNKTQIGYLDSVLEQIQNDDYYSTFFEYYSHYSFYILISFSYYILLMLYNYLNIKLYNKDVIY